MSTVSPHHACVFADTCACGFGGFVCWRAAALFPTVCIKKVFDLNPRLWASLLAMRMKVSVSPDPFNSWA